MLARVRITLTELREALALRRLRRAAAMSGVLMILTDRDLSDRARHPKIVPEFHDPDCFPPCS